MRALLDIKKKQCLIIKLVITLDYNFTQYIFIEAKF